MFLHHMRDHKNGDVALRCNWPDHKQAVELASRSKWLVRQPTLFREILLRPATIRHFSARQKIIDIDEGGHDLYFLLRGAVQVSVARGGLAVSPIHIVPSLHWFGELGAVTESLSLAQYTARVPSSTLVIPRETLITLRQENQAYYAAAFDLLARAVGDCFGLASSVIGLEAVDRVKLKLLWLSESSEASKGDGIVLVSQGDLAIMAGVSRPTVSKVLMHLESAGVVEVGYRKIRVLKRHLLTETVVPITDLSIAPELF
jgi:CRP-like cAMP-binding protein